MRAGDGVRGRSYARRSCGLSTAPSPSNRHGGTCTPTTTRSTPHSSGGGWSRRSTPSTSPHPFRSAGRAGRWAPRSRTRSAGTCTTRPAPTRAPRPRHQPGSTTCVSVEIPHTAELARRVPLPRPARRARPRPVSILPGTGTGTGQPDGRRRCDRQAAVRLRVHRSHRSAGRSPADAAPARRTRRSRRPQSPGASPNAPSA